LSVRGSGYRPGSIVTVELQPGSIVLGTAVVNAEGSFVFSVRAPENGVGKRMVVVKGESVSREPLSSETPVTIMTPAAVVDNLAFTGASLLTMVITALAVIASGLVLIRRSRSVRTAR
jgi:hypothetical protein